MHSRCSVNNRVKREEKGREGREGRGRKKEGDLLCGGPILRMKLLKIKAAGKCLQISRTLWITCSQKKNIIRVKDSHQEVYNSAEHRLKINLRLTEL